MSKTKWLAVFFLISLALAMTSVEALAKDYSIQFFNNMQEPQWIQNTNGYCTNLKAQLKNGTVVMASVTLDTQLKVATGVTLTISAALCSGMTLSGTCTFKKGTNDQPVTQSTSVNVTGCSDGRAIFINHAFGMWFSPN